MCISKLKQFVAKANLPFSFFALFCEKKILQKNNNKNFSYLKANNSSKPCHRQINCETVDHSFCKNCCRYGIVRILVNLYNQDYEIKLMNDKISRAKVLFHAPRNATFLTTTTSTKIHANSKQACRQSYKLFLHLYNNHKYYPGQFDRIGLPLCWIFSNVYRSTRCIHRDYNVFICRIEPKEKETAQKYLTPISIVARTVQVEY